MIKASIFLPLFTDYYRGTSARSHRNCQAVPIITFCDFLGFVSILHVEFNIFERVSNRNSD